MLAMCFLPLLFGCVPEFQGCKEPDGSRRVGVVPPFHGQPAPPGWLRTTSQVLVALHCRHYIYEAYGDDRGAWNPRPGRMRGGQRQARARCKVRR